MGSFDPFTLGHDDIVRRALPLFDKIIIGVGVNERKQYMNSALVRTQTIAALYAGEPKIEVKAYNDLTIDFAHREMAEYIIKGVRSLKDFEYEQAQADINRRLGSVETIFLMASPEHAAISSSVVRELLHFGKDVSQFLPTGAKEK